MAKIMYGNYNDLPWDAETTKKMLDGKVMCYMKCFAMEAANLHMCMGKMYNGMPIGPHTHPNEQIATCVKGECDYWVNGVPYRLAYRTACVGIMNVPPRYVHYAHACRSVGQAVRNSVYPVIALTLYAGSYLFVGMGVRSYRHTVVHFSHAHVQVGCFHREALHVAHHLSV